MFKFLKEKINKWTKKVAEAEQEKAIEKVEKESEKVAEEIKKEKEFREKIKEKTKEIKPKTAEEKEKEKLKAIEEAQKEELGQEIKILEPKKEEPMSEKGRVAGPVEVGLEEPIKKEKKGLFKTIAAKITKVKISEKEFDVYADELQDLLLENNVALEVTEKIINELKQEIVGKELLKKEIESEIQDVFKDIIREILIGPFKVEDKVKEKHDKEKEPYVIVFFGINGTGKTTTIAKIAEYLKKQGLSVVLAAADTFRAASIEQLQHHGERVGVKVISHNYGHDPAAVGFDAIKYAKKNAIDAVLIDTAGRMHTSKDLLREMEKIVKVTNPDLKLFIGESITGNDAIEQAKSFNWNIGIDGIILTKADIDEKGGTSLSVGHVTKKPILYLGTGQEYDAIEPFDKEKFIKRLGL